MLQGRLFAYGDARRYRLGVNRPLIPAYAYSQPGALFRLMAPALGIPLGEVPS